MKAKKIIGALAILGVLAGAYVWFFVYNKDHVNYQEEAAVFSGEADLLRDQAQQNTASFTEKFLNQAIEVQGTVQETGTTFFTLGSGVICNVDESQLKKMPKIGDEISVKGRLVGTDEDILTGEIICNLDQCVIIN